MSGESAEQLQEHGEETVASGEALALARVLAASENPALPVDPIVPANHALAAVQQVVAAALAGSDLQAALDAALERTLDALDAEVGAIVKPDMRRGRARAVAHRGLSRLAVAKLRDGGVEAGLAGRIMETGEPVVVANVVESALPLGVLLEERLHALAGAPLFAGDVVVGAIFAARRQVRPFSPGEVLLLAAIGRQVGAVIAGASQREEAILRANRVEKLYQATRQITEAPTHSAILAATARTAADITASPAAVLFLRGEIGASLSAVAGLGLSGGKWRELHLDPQEQIIVRPLLEGRTVCLANLEGDLVVPPLLREQFPELRSLAAVALRRNDEVAGMLMVFQRTRGAYGDEDLELLSALADAGGKAMDRAVALEGAKSEAERTAALNEIAKIALATADPERLLKALASQIRRLVKHDQISLALVGSDNQALDVLAVNRDGRSTVGKGTRMKLGDAAAGWVVANRLPLLRGNVEQESAFPWDGLMLAWGLRADISVPLSNGDKTLGALALASEEPWQYRESDVPVLQEIAARIALAIDSAQQYRQATADLHELQALRETVQYFSADLEIASLLHKVVTAAVDTLQADEASAAVVDDDGIARVRAVHNSRDVQVGDEVAPGEGLLGQVLVTRQPVLVHSTGEGKSDDREVVSSSLALPVWWQDRLIGILAVGTRLRGHRFGTRQVDKLQLLVKHAAVAIENARLYGKRGELAVAEERNRLARDLHDTIAQSLTGIVLELESVGDLVDSRPQEARQELDEALAIARRTLEEVRHAVWELHPTPLKSMTLEQAIEREMRAVTRQGNIATSLTVKGEAEALPREVETALFRIAQEALGNVRKHASARAIRSTLQFGDQEASLIIEDNGVGFSNSSSTTPTGGFGLTSMRERARQLGGELRVESTIGVGTRLTATIPYRLTAPALGVGALNATEPLLAPPSEDAIKVLVADDHPIARQGIRRMLEQHVDVAVIGEATDGMEAVSLSQSLQPDVVLMDLQMPRLSGVAAIEQLRESSPDAKVLIISTYDKDEFLFDGIKAGARGYLLKDVGAEALIQAVRAVSRGESLLQGVVAGKLVDRLGRLARGEDNEELTEREMEVLRLLAGGARNKEIARQLTIAEKTVKFHVANIFRKLGATSRTEALALALDRGLLHR